MYYIREVIKRGMDHKIYCEDSSLSFVIDERIVVIAAFDGCSTGKKSHFASELYAKLFRKSMQLLPVYNKGGYIYPAKIKSDLIEKFYYELLTAKVNLKLDFTEMLSTFVLTVIDVEKKIASTAISGDGLLFIDGVKALDIDCPENAPNYMIYQIEQGMEYEKMYQTSLNHLEFNYNKTISVTSDGMHTFKSMKEFSKQDTIDFLISDESFINSEAMLKRKANILENDGILHSDDLTIVRFIQH